MFSDIRLRHNPLFGLCCNSAQKYLKLLGVFFRVVAGICPSIGSMCHVFFCDRRSIVANLLYSLSMHPGCAAKKACAMEGY